MAVPSRTISIISACLSLATIAAGAAYWCVGSAETLAGGVDVLTTAVGVFWILGIGFTFASGLAILALIRGEPRMIPMSVIIGESLIFLFFIIGIALS
jgi:hypothetical protein